MISCIITGHGHFSIGVLDALETIAGPQEKMIALSFDVTASLQEYQSKLEHLIEQFISESDDLMIVTDLLGGTPFNTAMLLSEGKSNIRVLAGGNLPMLLELGIQRTMTKDLNEVTSKVLDTGKKGVMLGEIKQAGPVAEKDGI